MCRHSFCPCSFQQDCDFNGCGSYYRFRVGKIAHSCSGACRARESHTPACSWENPRLGIIIAFFEETYFSDTPLPCISGNGPRATACFGRRRKVRDFLQINANWRARQPAATGGSFSARQVCWRGTSLAVCCQQLLQQRSTWNQSPELLYTVNNAWHSDGVWDF